MAAAEARLNARDIFDRVLQGNCLLVVHHLSRYYLDIGGGLHNRRIGLRRGGRTDARVIGVVRVGRVVNRFPENSHSR